jgi:IS5 family transposase
MIRPRHHRSLYDSIGSQIIEDHQKLGWEDWMKRADELLDDEELVEIVQERLQRRRPNSRVRGREGTPAEVVLRMLALKHMRNWSFEALEREVRPNLVYREFTRIRDKKVPDAKTMIKIRQALGADTIEKINERLVALAIQRKVTRGRRMRVDTTAVETNVHYPTDSSLLGDGVRTITRLVGKINKEVGEGAIEVRNRARSVKRRLVEIAKSARARGEEFKERKARSYRKLLGTTKKVVKEAKAVLGQVQTGLKKKGKSAKRIALRQLSAELARAIEVTERVIAQTKARIVDGDTHYEGKLASIFEPQTEVIRRGKAGKPTEFGKMVKIQEAENQIITSYEVYDRRPPDSDLLIPAVEKHAKIFGRVPDLVAADAGFYSSDNIVKATEAGVKRVSVPNKKTGSRVTWKKQKERWFKKGQRWRVGCEGRISVLKRRHGMNRSRYRGVDGMRCWVGLSVFADNLTNAGKALSGTG